MEASKFNEMAIADCKMTDLVEFFNNAVADPQMFSFPYIYKMEDEKVWQRIGERHETYDIAAMPQLSIEQNGFSVEHGYFAFDEESNSFYSFNTPQDIINIFGLDELAASFECLEWTIGTIMPGENRNTYWATICKSGVCIGSAVLVLPLGTSCMVTLYFLGKPEYQFTHTLRRCPMNWKVEDYFNDFLAYLNEEHSWAIPFEANPTGIFRTK